MVVGGWGRWRGRWVGGRKPAVVVNRVAGGVKRGPGVVGARQKMKVETAELGGKLTEASALECRPVRAPGDFKGRRRRDQATRSKISDTAIVCGRSVCRRSSSGKNWTYAKRIWGF